MTSPTKTPSSKGRLDDNDNEDEEDGDFNQNLELELSSPTKTPFKQRYKEFVFFIKGTYPLSSVFRI